MLEYSPSNPDPVAQARVYHPFPIPHTCNHCGGLVAWTLNSAVYGRAVGTWPYIYICDDCGARVGIHPGTNIPLGTLATDAEREARIIAKRHFFAWMESEKRSKREAYQALRARLEVEPQHCHFAKFDVAMCNKIIALFPILSRHGSANHVVGDAGN